MILQRHPDLNLQIRERGCYFMSILYHVEHIRGIEFLPDAVNSLYQLIVNLGHMEKDCYILRPEEIFDYFGVLVRYSNRHEPPNRVCAPDEIEILKFIYERPYLKPWEHFVAGDGWGGVVYDPWGNSKAVAYGYLANKRIFRKLG